MISKQCPACKSPQIVWYAGGVTGNYECKKCGYVGPIVIELEKRKHKKASKKSKS